MLQTRPVFLLTALLLLLPCISFAGTGILEVQSEPSGAHIWVDGVDAGKTPYQNLEMPAGRHSVKAVLSTEYPPQVQEVHVDERSPKVVVFKFARQSMGKFIGQEIVSTTSKYKGSVTFASIPTGARVIINGEPLKQHAPFGYTDVEVGKYEVEFQLDGRNIRSTFDVVQGKTVKLIADFRAGNVVNKSSEEKTPPQAQGGAAAPADQQAPRTPQPAIQAAATQPAATPADARPEPAEGAAPYGELQITVNVRRDPRLKYSDYFDLSFPKLPIGSLSGPLFPEVSSMDRPVFKDNFEYMNDAEENTRQFTARVHFSSRDTRSEDGAVSSLMTVHEGRYDLKVTRQRMVDSFYSIQKVLDESAVEAIEIVRGNRLIVEIDSRINADNKLHYEIKRSYVGLGKKKGSSRQPAGVKTSKRAAEQTEHAPVFMRIEN